jgi:hypothetical protein
MLIQRKTSNSPYLHPGRLPDLLAAIQSMALHERYRRSAADWADLRSGDKNKASHWKAVFEQHPEFFRPSINYPGDFALVWRRAGNNRYHRRLGRVLDREEYDALTEEDRKRFISRAPVPEGQIKTLLDTAIGLHKNAMEAHRDWRWWTTPASAIVSSFIGAIIGGFIKSH